MVEVRKRDKESTESLLRRFTRRVNNSKVLSQAKDARYRTKDKSKKEQRKTAMNREQFIKERKQLEKMGKVAPHEKLPNKYKLKIKSKLK
ncbi:MAG: hypothetical protein BRC23_00765 [Parcubacteria group bacterium SW_4_49_11]|jgi:ribosomal protein S21|nr:MAG: hypothetical protein BRC23_00765 [Parcubacteria group bacterium SW_4_49_11]